MLAHECNGPARGRACSLEPAGGNEPTGERAATAAGAVQSRD